MTSLPVKFSKKLLIALFVLLTVELSADAAYYAHQRTIIKAIESQYQKKKADLDTARQLGAQLQPEQDKLRSDQEQLAHLEHSLSTQEYVPTLLAQLQKLATDTNNQILTVKPIPTPPPPPPPANPVPGASPAPTGQPGAAQPGYDKYQVELGLQGQYKDVMTFLMKLTDFPKIVSVDKFQVTSQPPNAAGVSMVNANLTFTAYILKES